MPCDSNRDRCLRRGEAHEHRECVQRSTFDRFGEIDRLDESISDREIIDREIVTSRATQSGHPPGVEDLNIGLLTVATTIAGTPAGPFGGSGTTLIAAEKTSRRAYVMEFDPIYVDTTITRFEKLTGQEAVHFDTGLTFTQMKVGRVESAPESIAQHAEEGGAENVE